MPYVVADLNHQDGAAWVGDRTPTVFDTVDDARAAIIALYDADVHVAAYWWRVYELVDRTPPS